jgi:hypothetical protein
MRARAGHRRRLMPRRPGGVPAGPGGRVLALGLLWSLLLLGFLLVFPVLLNPEGLNPWAWEGLAGAGAGAVVAACLLAGALGASARDRRVAYALAILGALIGWCALVAVAATAYLP